jgi:hypothetical protein
LGIPGHTGGKNHFPRLGPGLAKGPARIFGTVLQDQPGGDLPLFHGASLFTLRKKCKGIKRIRNKNRKKTGK